MHFAVDAIGWNTVSGWAFSPDFKLRVEVWANDQCLIMGQPDVPRSDVANHFVDKSALLSGFKFSFSPPGDSADIVLKLTKIDDDGNAVSDPIEVERRLVFDQRVLLKAFADSRDHANVRSALPLDVAAGLQALWPETKIDSGHDGASFEKLKLIFRASVGSRTPEPIVRYMRFLSAMDSHCKFVCRYFPAINEDKSITDKDYVATLNSAREMMSIANQLYVLRSYGINGDFAEFGCFKGFSSSMLSYACNLLGIRMHIFDSFEGLPESESRYYSKGDFRGSMEEVKENITRYGSIEAVQFHKGYFSDSIPQTKNQISSLMAIWMDVDLLSSAQDVMGLFGRLDRLGSLFSHECVPENFGDGNVDALRPSPNNVVPAILQAFGAEDRVPSGRFIAGSTGAFWDSAVGIPVLDEAYLSELVSTLR